MKVATVRAEIQVPTNRTYVGTCINGIVLTEAESAMVLKHLLRKFWHLADVIAVGNFRQTVIVWLEVWANLGVDDAHTELLRFTQALEHLKVVRSVVPYPLLLIHTQ